MKDKIIAMIDNRILDILRNVPIKERDNRVEELVLLKEKIVKEIG